MKKCPYCAEEIQLEAIKCKHCSEFLDLSKRPLPPALPVSGASGLPFYFKPSFIIFTFVTLPPFALPSVWMHPRLHWGWKIVITLAIVGFCWIAYTTIREFLRQFEEMTKMISEMRI